MTHCVRRLALTAARGSSRDGRCSRSRSFYVIAVASVAGPFLAYTVARDRMRHPLDELNTWLQANNSTVMAVLLLVIGVVLIGKGVGGL